MGMEIAPAFSVMFSAYIAFGVLVMLNLVTGVFVEGAWKLRQKDKESDLAKIMQTIFAQGGYEDESGEKRINMETWLDGLERPEMLRFFESIDMEADEAQLVFNLLDKHGKGELSCAELVSGGLHLQGPAKAIDLARMNHVMEEIQLIHGQLQEVRASLVKVSEAVRREKQSDVARPP